MTTESICTCPNCGTNFETFECRDCCEGFPKSAGVRYNSDWFCKKCYIAGDIDESETAWYGAGRNVYEWNNSGEQWEWETLRYEYVNR